MDVFGSSDPFFILRLGSKYQKTSVKKNNLNPTYNETFSFRADLSASTKILSVECFDWDRLSAQDFIGSIQIPYEEYQDEPTRKWFPLNDKKSKHKGDVELEITYSSEGGGRSTPPPVYVVGQAPPAFWNTFETNPPEGKYSWEQSRSPPPPPPPPAGPADAVSAELESYKLKDILRDAKSSLFPRPLETTVSALSEKRDIVQRFAALDTALQHIRVLQKLLPARDLQAVESYADHIYISPGVLSGTSSRDQAMAARLRSEAEMVPFPFDSLSRLFGEYNRLLSLPVYQEF